MLLGRTARASGFDGRAADSSDVRVVLPLRTSASAMPPAGPRSLNWRLRKRQKQVKRASAASVACCAAVTHGRVGSRWQGSRLERREGRVALEDLGERHASRGAEAVLAEAAQTAKEGEQGECRERAWRGALLARTPTLGTWFEGRPSCAHLSVVSVVLVFSAAATSAPPAAPSWLRSRSNSATW